MLPLLRRRFNRKMQEAEAEAQAEAEAEAGAGAGAEASRPSVRCNGALLANPRILRASLL